MNPRQKNLVSFLERLILSSFRLFVGMIVFWLVAWLLDWLGLFETGFMLWLKAVFLEAVLPLIYRLVQIVESFLTILGFIGCGLAIYFYFNSSCLDRFTKAYANALFLSESFQLLQAEVKNLERTLRQTTEKQNSLSQEFQRAETKLEDLCRVNGLYRKNELEDATEQVLENFKS